MGKFNELVSIILYSERDCLKEGEGEDLGAECVDI